MGARTTNGVAIGATILVALFGGLNAISARQTPVLQPVDEHALREYTGVYQWGPSAFVYLRGDQVAPAIRAVVLHDDRRLAREADSRLPTLTSREPSAYKIDSYCRGLDHRA